MRARTRSPVGLRLALVALVLVTLVGVALARPGGGESYSGGGGHGGGGGGGGGDGDIFALIELIIWIIRLCIVAPHIGLPLVGGIVAWVIYSSYKQHKNKDWDSGPPVSLQRAIDLEPVRKLDQRFSPIVFEDFAFRLFSAAHRARHSPEQLATVAPYVSAQARAALARREPVGAPVQQVIVGALRVVHADVPRAPTDAQGQPARVQVELELEANIATAQATFFTVERWRLARDVTARSPRPGERTTFPCPNCGAPWQATATGTQTCASCNQVVDNGRFDWVVEEAQLLSSDPRPPTLTTEVEERGTDLPTYRQHDVDKRFAKLRAIDPEVDHASLEARLRVIYAELAKAWSVNDLAPVRGFVSDGLYDYLSYWVDAYRRQGLRNELVDMRITRSEVAKVTRDAWYHAVTIRLWATGKDYVVREADGRVVRGSKRKERPYSEYWTLIRSAGRKGAAQAARTCGNCGAPLDVSMAGACTYCGAHVTSGEFDWVVSKIEQDDSYRG